MNNKRRYGLFPLLAVGCLIAACGGSVDPVGGFGTYSHEDQSAVITYQIPAPQNNPLLVRVEEYRAIEGAEPHSYILVTVDNRFGSEEQVFHDINVVTDAGLTLAFVRGWEVVEDWREYNQAIVLSSSFPDDLSRTIHNKGVLLQTDMMNLDSVLPGAISQYLMMSHGTLDSVGRVFLIPGWDLLSMAEAAEKGASAIATMKTDLEPKELFRGTFTFREPLPTPTPMPTPTRVPSTPVPTIPPSPTPEPTPTLTPVPSPIPTAVPSYNNIGISHHISGNFELAIQAFDEAIRLDPQYVAAYYNRGIVHADLGQYSLAIQSYDEAIRLDPEYAKAYFNRGIAYYILAANELAIQSYDEAIRFDPQEAGPYYYRGLSYANLGQNELAIQSYDEAIRLDPQYVYEGTKVTAYNSRGYAHYDLGQYELAIQSYDEAIRLNPQDADAYFWRGLAFQALGNSIKAEQDFAKYKELEG